MGFYHYPSTERMVFEPHTRKKRIDWFCISFFSAHFNWFRLLIEITSIRLRIKDCRESITPNRPSIRRHRGLRIIKNVMNIINIHGFCLILKLRQLVNFVFSPFSLSLSPLIEWRSIQLCMVHRLMWIKCRHKVRNDASIGIHSIWMRTEMAAMTASIQLKQKYQILATVEKSLNAIVRNVSMDVSISMYFSLENN